MLRKLPVARRQSRVCGAGGVPRTPVRAGSERHRVILWTALAHILIDFSALGWDVFFT
jgi:hypothetical protein